ncbi:MAG: hypothetical protein QOH60_2548 [Mycobacterium sp.]|jgi:hypothetical protein|nr:hypothetical protein [Mycobacterium sp.]
MGVRFLVATVAIGCVVAGCSDSNETHVVVLKAVDSYGNLAPGWAVDETWKSGPIDCSGGAQSPFDVTDGVRFCGTTADDGAACWPKGANQIYCLADAQKRTVKLANATGLNKPLQRRTDPPTPAALILHDGTVCRTRTGGTWPSRPDGTSPTHKCSTQPGKFMAVWATSGAPDGIHKSSDGWTVDVGSDSGPLTRHTVSTAYFVGMG